MNTRWMDGWDYCSTSTQRVAIIGGTLPLVTAGAGRRGTNGLTGNAVNAYAAYGSSGVTPAVVAGIACLHVGASGWGKVLGLGSYLAGGAEHVALFSQSDGSIAVYGGSGVGLGVGPLFGISDPGVLSQDVSQYIECGLALDVADGSIEVRVGTATVFKVTGVATLVSGRPASADLVWLYPLDDRRRYDDGYLNASGATAFAGNVRITARFPDGDGDTIEWVRNTGTANYQTVFERVPDEDLTYNAVEDADGTPTDLFHVQELQDRRAGILAVEIISRQRLDGGGTGTLAHMVKTDPVGTQQLAPDVVMVSGYQYGSTIMNTVPTLASGWGDEQFDQTQFGYRRIT